MASNDVPYFKRILKKEKDQLIAQCQKWQNVLSAHTEEETLPEYAEGEIRTIIGLTELLLDQKLKQFGGLIKDCENKSGEIEVTCADLQGFWDMVYYEVEKLHKSFHKLKDMQMNNWENTDDVAVPAKKIKVMKPKVKPQPKSSSGAKAHILAARQRLAEAKAQAMKSKGLGTIPVVEGKENLVSISLADSTTDENITTSVAKKTGRKTNEGKKKGLGTDQNSVQPASTSKKHSIKSRKVKEIIPLSCITRSAKRALLEHNKAAN